MQTAPPKLSQLGWKWSTLPLVLLLALIHGLLWVFLVPPWQHYDEPGHFEYAWLIANRPGLPEAGTFDLSMRREVLASMIAHGFFREMESQPDLIGGQQGIDIGIPQTADRPLYYWLAALPLRLVRGTDVTFQLYLARILSLLLYLITVGATLGTATLLFPSGQPLRWILPVGLVMLPGFVDLMTSVNNDVGAIAFFSLFILASLNLLLRGPSPYRLLAVIATALLAAWMKSTASPALALAPFVILFAALHTRRRLALALIFGIGVLSLPFVFSWGNAAGWTSINRHKLPNATLNEHTPVGMRAFRLASEPGEALPEMAQFLSMQQVEALRGKTVTIGAWIWSNQSVDVWAPVLYNNGEVVSKIVKADTEPKFYSFHETIEQETQRLGLGLTPFVHPPATSTEVYYDGIVLVDKNFAEDTVPHFEDPSARTGKWDGKIFQNFIDNPSAEYSWPYFRFWAEDMLARIYPAKPAVVLTALLDWDSGDWYFRSTLKSFFRTFWAQFGWGHVSLSPFQALQPYRILIIITMLGIFGTFLALIRQRSQLNWIVVSFLGAVLFIIWGAALLRGIESLFGRVFIPSARYAFPAIIPTVLVLTTGWVEWARLGEGRFRLPSWVKSAVFWTFFLVLDMIAIITLMKYYY